MKSKARLPAHRFGSDNVFADLGVPNARGAFAKAKLVVEIAKTLRARDLSQRALAATIALDQAKVSRLMRGDTTGFSTDRLLGILAKLGHDVEIRIGPRKTVRGLVTVNGSSHTRGATGTRSARRVQ